MWRPSDRGTRGWVPNLPRAGRTGNARPPARRALGRSAGFAFVVALLAGCGSDGRYAASWRFFATPDATAEGDPTESAAAACGAHGVDAILVSGVSAGGDRHQTTALCAAGQLTDGVGPGDWQFTFTQLDVHGNPISLPGGAADPELTGSVQEEKTADLGAVTLIPRPACRDGIDNDRDGRVDLDDSDCGGSPDANSEGPETAAAHQLR
jgi:hypothetical protein